MTESRIIVCDHCGNDLTTTGNSHAERIVLAAQPIPSREGYVADMHFLPVLKQTYHFCWMPCLRQWIEAGGEKL